MASSNGSGLGNGSRFRERSGKSTSLSHPPIWWIGKKLALLRIRAMEPLTLMKPSRLKLLGVFTELSLPSKFINPHPQTGRTDIEKLLKCPHKNRLCGHFAA
ncbi:MAG TPA: hypothetical protein VGI63_00125 [Verrucomicrobiae bacterium]|jgi:hypothetical protein